MVPDVKRAAADITARAMLILDLGIHFGIILCPSLQSLWARSGSLENYPFCLVGLASAARPYVMRTEAKLQALGHPRGQVRVPFWKEFSRTVYGRDLGT